MMDMLTMGGYGAYVWTSFGLTLGVLVICAFQARQRHAQALNKISRRIRAMESDV